MGQPCDGNRMIGKWCRMHKKCAQCHALHEYTPLTEYLHLRSPDCISPPTTQCVKHIQGSGRGGIARPTRGQSTPHPTQTKHGAPRATTKSMGGLCSSRSDSSRATHPTNTTPHQQQPALACPTALKTTHCAQVGSIVKPHCKNTSHSTASTKPQNSHVDNHQQHQ